MSAPAAPAPACSIATGRLLGRRPSAISHLARAGRYRRAVERRHLARRLRQRSRGRCAQPASTPQHVARHRLRRHLLAGRASGRDGAPSAGRPVRRSASATSSSGWIIAPPIRRGGSTPTGHRVLRYVGGTISPEMETPKLLWLQRTCPEIFDAAWQFFDLTDFLTWRPPAAWRAPSARSPANGPISRMSSAGTPSYFRASGSARWPTRALPGSARESSTGTPLGAADGAAAAEELGLQPGTPSAPA